MVICWISYVPRTKTWALFFAEHAKFRKNRKVKFPILQTIDNHGQNMLRKIATWDSFGWRAVTDTMVLRDIIINYVSQTYSHFNCGNWVHHIQMFTNPSLFPTVLFFLPPDPLEQCWATQINTYMNLTFSKPSIGLGRGEGESLLFVYYCPNECYWKSQICSGNWKCLNTFVQDCR